MTPRANPNGDQLVAEARRTAIAEMLRTSGSVSVAEVTAELGISAMTVRRDLAELARRGVARRTYGGAVVPSIATHEDSFTIRLGTGAGAKGALASAAAATINPGDSVFLDSSTTSYFVAREILDLRIDVTIVTNSLPIMQLVAADTTPQVELVGLGGSLRPRTQSFVGPQTVRAIESHFTDRAFLSVKAVSDSGVLTDPDLFEAETKRAMVGRARDSVLLIDRSKLFARGLNAVAPVADVTTVLTCGLTRQELEQLRALHPKVLSVDRAERADSHKRLTGSADAA